MTADFLHKDWALFKKTLKVSIDEGNIEESYRLLEKIAIIGYTYNFLNFFRDDDLEHCLYKLSDQIIEKAGFKEVEKKKPGKIIFYDFFTRDYRVFTQQYLDYFIKNEIEFLYIMFDHNYLEKKQIVQSINNYSGGRFCIIKTKNTTVINSMRAVYDEVYAYGADKIFIQNAPWDIFSYCLSILIKKHSKIQSYLINITDHTFWMGATIFDFVIDFRKYGAQLNHYYRGMPLQKILIVNTPAYIDNSIAFKGFSVSVVDKVVGFGGGSVYKIKDEAHTFLNLIKILLLQNENFIFFFANVGDTDYVSNFIRDNGLEGRLIAIGDREDICAIFENIDLFFNTFPYGGGNMLSYAFQNSVPIVTMYDKNFIHTRLDVIFDIDLRIKYILEDKSDYIAYANKLIRSAAFRREVSELCSLEIKKRASFDEGLTKLMENDISFLSPKSLERIHIDTDFAMKFHINKIQFQPTFYFSLKSSILINHFFWELLSGWKTKDYWKYNFTISIKERLKIKFPFLLKLKTLRKFSL